LTLGVSCKWCFMLQVFFSLAAIMCFCVVYIWWYFQKKKLRATIYIAYTWKFVRTSVSKCFIRLLHGFDMLRWKTCC
jgi:hypothetical protein